MSIVLQNQIEATERSADELLGQERDRARFCHNVRDLSRSIVELFNNINADVERWQGELAASKNGKLEEMAAMWIDLYRRLNTICEKAARLIRDGERNGPAMDGKREFLIAWRELRGIACIPHDRVEIAAEQMNRGELRPLGEVRNELWDTPVA